MKIRFKHIVLTGLTGILALSSCSEQIEDIDKGTSSQVILVAPQVAEHVEARSTTPAKAGNYLFGWKSKANKDILTSVTVKSGGEIGKIGVYWENITPNATLTLSNAGNFTAADNQTKPIDILWGKLDKQSSTTNALKFTLYHKMSQAKIKLAIPNLWNITSIQMTDLKKQYTFSNLDGTVNPCGTSEEAIDINTKDATVMLPPQEKGENSKLIVKVTDDQGLSRTFSHKLPYAMAQNPNGGDQWEDIVIKFRAGYILEISATITNNLNNEIHFTYATLTDWKSKTESTISARPAGIYTVDDWNKFADIYNTNSEETNVLLCKYGTYSSGWTFTIQRNIDMTDKKVTKLNSFSGKLKATAPYCIKGKNAEDLGVEGKLDGDVFQSTN